MPQGTIVPNFMLLLQNAAFGLYWGLILSTIIIVLSRNEHELYMVPRILFPFLLHLTSKGGILTHYQHVLQDLFHWLFSLRYGSPRCILQSGYSCLRAFFLHLVKLNGSCHNWCNHWNLLSHEFITIHTILLENVW